MPAARESSGEIEHFFTFRSTRSEPSTSIPSMPPLPLMSLSIAAAGPFSDPVIQDYPSTHRLPPDSIILVEVGFRPGVTDNVGRTAGEAIEYITGQASSERRGRLHLGPVPVYRQALTRRTWRRLPPELLCNTLIQRYQILDAATFSPRMGCQAPMSPRCR